MLHDALSVAVVALCMWAIVSPRVPTGVFGTAGLGIVAVAALWSVDDAYNPFAAIDLLLSGVLFIGAGLAWRLLRRERAATQPPRELDHEYHGRVSGGRSPP